MAGLKHDKWKIALIVIGCLLVNMLLHLVVFPLTLPSDFVPSILVERGLVPPVAGIGMLVTLGALSIVFALIQDRLVGKRFVKGLWFGIAFTGLWVLGFTEVSALSDTTLLTEVINGLPDSLTILLMSLLLGFFIARDTLVTDKKKPGNQLGGAAVVAATFFMGRYLSYWVFKTNSIFHPEPNAVFIWTLAMAAWIGLVYGILGNASLGHSPMKRGLFFIGVVFGIDWLLFNLFLPIFLDIPIWNMVSRALLDLAFIGLGVFVNVRIFGFIDHQASA